MKWKEILVLLFSWILISIIISIFNTDFKIKLISVFGIYTYMIFILRFFVFPDGDD